jgi:hypothetical protein
MMAARSSRSISPKDLITRHPPLSREHDARPDRRPRRRRGRCR